MWVGLSNLRLIGLTAAALVLALLLTGQEGPPQSIALAGIDVEELACVNIKLLVPDGAPNVTAEKAREAAKAGDPFNLPVQQVVLARLAQDGPNDLGRDNLVWVVVSGDGTVRQMGVPGPMGDEASRSVPYTYGLALMDALTGEFIFEHYGPLPPNYTCP